MKEFNARRLELEAESLMREVERLQAEGNPRLLRTLFYIVRALDVDLDFSQARVPNEVELAALYQTSEVGARLVTAYSEMMSRASRKVLARIEVEQASENIDEP